MLGPTDYATFYLDSFRFDIFIVRRLEGYLFPDTVYIGLLTKLTKMFHFRNKI